MENDDDKFGTDPRKLYRSDDPSTSEEAAETVDTKVWEKQAYRIINGHGIHGCISDEVRSHFPGVPYSTITARYAALEEKGLITCGPDTRTGNSGVQERVMRAIRPPPECSWCARISVKTADGEISIQTVIVRANNERRAISRAKAKVVSIKLIEIKKAPDELPPPNDKPFASFRP